MPDQLVGLLSGAMSTGDARSVTRGLLQRRVAEREALLARVRSVLLSDRRVTTAWLFGSIGRGEGDAFSDLDVVAVVTDEDIARVAGDGTRPLTFRAICSSPRGRFVSRVADPLLLLEAPQNAPAGGAFMSSFFPGVAGPHGIDWVWQPMSTAQRPPQSLLLFARGSPPVGTPGDPDQLRERVPDPEPKPEPAEIAVRAACSFWSMLLWSAKGVARDPDASTMPLLTYATEALRKLERLGGEDPVAPVIMGPLGTGGEKLRVLRSYAGRMRVLLPQLSVEVDLPHQLSPQVERLLQLVQRVGALR